MCNRWRSAHVFCPTMVRVSALCLLVMACGKRDGGADLAPASSALAASTNESATTWHFAIEPAGSTHVEMPGLKETIRAETTAAAGTVDVVPSDLAMSRGTVRIDLSTFTTHTFGSDDGTSSRLPTPPSAEVPSASPERGLHSKDATQTKHARTWLEVVVDDKINESMRWADFAIRSVDALSAHDVTKAVVAREGGQDVRRVTMTVHGDLLVHGHEVAKDAVVEVAFRYAAGAGPPARPNRIDIESKQPMRVVLKQHDVGPRDPEGKIAAWTASLLSKVAETADVTVHLSAVPAS